jgi:putative membrane protein
MLMRLALGWALNILALWLANEAFVSVSIHGAAAYLIGGAVLGVANAVLKPLLTLLTLPLVIVTLGLFILVINIGMVALAEWIAPNLSIDGFWTYVGTVVIVWLVNWIADQLIDRKPAPRRLRTSRF